MKTVISASRRTDIPAFYMDWFMGQIQNGFFEVINPYNRKLTIVPATPDKVHTIVLWSKNFGPFIKGGYGRKLNDMGYNLFFNFTINSDSARLEPEVPPLKGRLEQLEYLCRRFDARCITWRFDPICFYQTTPEKIRNNLNEFALIADQAFTCGIRRCITSFMDNYAKIQKRTAALPNFEFFDPPLESKREILLAINRTLTIKKIALYTCCEKKLLETLPEDAGIKPSSCIPNRLLVEIFGGSLSFKQDTGQRVKDGCGCMVSVDIGSYHLHPCYHNCLFCYANPAPKEKKSPQRRRERKDDGFFPCR